MKIQSKTEIPSSVELMEALKQEYSHKYDIRLYGIGDDKTIIVRKSFFVGAQITRDRNEITIDGIAPSALASLISILLQQLANLFILFSPSRYKKFIVELAVFLNNKYNKPAISGN